MCTCIQNFDSIASHLELAILSRKFRTTDHAQSSAVEYFNFFSIEVNLSLQDLKFYSLNFSPGYGYNASKTSNILRLFNFQNNNS